jgi:hypothetical protein
MIIAPVNAPPSEVQITQNSDLAKLAIGSPNLAATPSLKKKAQPSLPIAQAFPAPSTVVQGAETKEKTPAVEPSTPAEATQYPKARIMPSPLVSPKEQTKLEQTTPDTQPLTPDVKPDAKEQQKTEPLTPEQPLQKPEQLLPESKPLTPDVKPESKEQQKPQQILPESKPLVPDVKPDVKEQQKPEQVIPESKPLVPDVQPESQPQPVAPETKQDSKEQSPAPLTPPSQVIPPQQQQNPLPSGPPATEPGNYPNNTGPGSVYYNQNYIAPAVSFGNDTLIGAASRFGIGRNLSVRPSLFLGNTTRIAVPLTYDFGFNDNEQFEKNPLVVFHAGGGLDYSSSGGTNKLSPLVVFGADVYLGDGASVLLQIGNTFNSSFVAVAGIGLQF